MKQITMNLNENHLRPITELSAFTYEMVDNAVNDLYGGWEIISDEMRSRGRPITTLTAFHKLKALINTGADFPVLIEDKEVLEKPGVVSLHKKVYFTGIGGSIQTERAIGTLWNEKQG